MTSISCVSIESVNVKQTTWASQGLSSHLPASRISKVLSQNLWAAAADAMQRTSKRLSSIFRNKATWSPSTGSRLYIYSNPIWEEAKIGIRNVSLGDFCFFLLYTVNLSAKDTKITWHPQVMLLVSHGTRLWEKFHRSSLHRLPNMFIISLSEIIKPLGYQYKCAKIGICLLYFLLSLLSPLLNPEYIECICYILFVWNHLIC